MGDNSFLTPAFAILVIGIIAVVFWLVTRAKKKRNKK
ncbi:cbb3-type cytochrome oxidase subunit 3 [Xanthomonas arboricola]|nr:cbb3-type cytochrome oxidase subunit 3 [Xanthomonas sp. 3793]MCS3807736.1 cbb3-type cytochrome oxidase subunit 3 [Xanthomonas sp. 4461]